MHFTILLFVHFASAVPLVKFFLDENPDLTLETFSTNSDLFPVSTDSDLFFEAENAADLLFADNDFCLSDVNVDFLSTSKIRIRDSCPSTSFDPILTIPTFNQASPGLKLIERTRLNKLFGVGSTTKLKSSDGNDLCPFATPSGSTIPVCDSGSWADAIREAGGHYTLFHIRPCSFHPFLLSFLPSFSSCLVFLLCAILKQTF